MESPEKPQAGGPHRIGLSAGLIGIATMTSRILGLIRDQVLAFFFGAGDAMDAFNVAFRIPNLVRDLFAEGAMSAAFVPTFTSTLTLKGRAEAWRLGSLVINGLILVTGVLVILGIIFTRPLILLFAGDFAAVPGKIDLTVGLTRIMLPFLSLVAIAVALMGMLNAFHRFFIPALSPAMFNVATIICAFALVPVLPALGIDPITAIAIGTILGGLGQVAIQWPLLRREGFRYRLLFDPRDEGLRQVLFLMVPGMLGLAAVQINLLVNTMLATGEGTGPVSWLNYAFRLMYLPIGLLGVSIATASLPRISQYAALDDLPALRATVARSLRLIFMLNVPAMAGLLVLAHPIVAVIFEHGKFKAEDTEATTLALQYYAPGLLGYSAVKIAAPSFYALKESRTPVLVGALTVAVNIVLNVTLVKWIGFKGLALGTGLAALFNSGMLLWILRRRLGGLEGRQIAISLSKITAASLVMAAAAAAAEWGLRTVLPGGSIGIQALRLAASILLALVVLALSARALRIGDFDEALGMVTRRFRRRYR